jgi:cellulose synthase/poly-beta-1,6-N-acetylglucosamine synthase-like glycosyltransferase
VIAEVVFWTCLAIIAMTYAGYPVVLGLLALTRRRPAPVVPDPWPKVTALVVAFNEERQILNKVRNILENGYPADRIEVIVCSDGSTDRTNELVETFGDGRVRLAASPKNIGVNEAFALGAARASGDLLLMTDSGGLFEEGAIRTAVCHFADPKVGFVSGRIVFENPLKSSIGSGYRAYWLIETGVRQLESRLGLGVVTVGAFEMIRKAAYIPVPSRFNNDIAAPMYAHSLGYLCRFEPQAVLVTAQRKTPKQDFGRRVRIAVRAWSTIPYLASIVPILRNLGSWAALLCHKYLRYVTWVFMLGTLVANVMMLDSFFYQATLVSQAVAYAAALAGWGLAAAGGRSRLLTVPFYFCLLQAAGMVGLMQTLLGRRVGTWKPVD